MNEAEARTALIDPRIKAAAGVEGSKALCEYYINPVRRWSWQKDHCRLT